MKKIIAYYKNDVLLVHSDYPICKEIDTYMLKGLTLLNKGNRVS